MDEFNDPHASKIDPNDPRLRLNLPKGRVLKKGPVAAIAFLLVGLVLIAVTIALIPPSKKADAEKDSSASLLRNQLTISDLIKKAPDNKDPLTNISSALAQDQVPKLGDRLPGDLGHSMVSPSLAQAQELDSQRQGLANQFSNNGKSSSPYGQGSGPGPGQVDPVKQAIVQEREKALTAGLFFSGDDSVASDPPQNNNQKSTSADDSVAQAMELYREQMQSAGIGSGPDSMFASAGSDQNMQARKNDFIQGGGQRDKNYVQADMTKPRSPYEVKAGTVIPISLITGINSDLPGEIIGQVRENVYDTVSGNYLLIPQGTRLLATYDSMVAYAQNRVLICWNRLIRPDGTSINLEGAPGVDLSGYAGFADRVDNHFLRLIGGVLISSALSVTATASQGNNVGSDDMTLDKRFAANVGQSINDAGQEITKKNLAVQPTITIRPGFSVNVLVNKDMVIPPYQG